MSEDTSIYKQNVFNSINNNSTKHVAQAYVSDEDEDTESYHLMGAPQEHKKEKQLLEASNMVVNESSPFKFNAADNNILNETSGVYVNYDISLSPDDSNDLPGDNEDSNSSYLINNREHTSENNVSYSSNRGGSQSVIYKNTSNGESKNDYNNPENSKNSLILTNSMIQTVTKSPKKNNVLDSLDMLKSHSIGGDQAQWRLYRDDQKKIPSKTSLEQKYEPKNENDFDSLGFQGLKLQNPIHENVKQVSSEIESSSGSEAGGSFHGNAPMKNINALNTKHPNHMVENNADSSIGPATEAAKVFDRIVFKNNLKINKPNAETSMELELEEKDDFLPPFGFEKKAYKNNNNYHNILITEKSGLSSATTAVASASSSNNHKQHLENLQHLENEKANCKHKKDLSTTTPEDIGMIYHESNAVWNWKGKSRAVQETNNFNEEADVIANVINDSKQIVANPIGNINNSNSLQNNSEDIMNTAQIMAKQSFVNSRFVSKQSYRDNSYKNNAAGEPVDDDSCVSDLSQPFKIKILEKDFNYGFEDNESCAEAGEEDLDDQDTVGSEHTTTQSSIVEGKKLNSDENEYHLDINSISKSSFDKLTLMLDASPFDLNLNNSFLHDVLENLAILEELNPFLLKLNLSVNDSIQFNTTNNSISKLFHLKELVMRSMHLKNLDFLIEGTHLHLEHLNLSDNDLITFQTPRNLSPLISLKTLNLARNKFTDHLRLDLSRFFPNLEVLNLNGNSELQSLEFIVPYNFNLKKLSLNGSQSLRSVMFFPASGNIKEELNVTIDELHITQCRVEVIKALGSSPVKLNIKSMKLSLSELKYEDSIDLSFPSIENLVVKNSPWDNTFFGKLNFNLETLQLTNISSDLNIFDIKVKNDLSNLTKITISDTNLSTPINPFYDFLLSNLQTRNLRELNIRENVSINSKLFKDGDTKTTKVFRIATSMKFQSLTQMDGFDLLRIWEDRR